ncbi:MULTISPECIES: hypothetical protein [unclassified Moritella]|uniref:hypothetical protein n=1 Tax=unclassified Moritella TaxID=2637987 RepID=UPI001BA91DD5|nr:MULTISPECIES: hypothetical protein [unclassified Moritella]QUM85614.1 hypothetical protein HWV02_14385 [Moritella sp. 28]QUM89831.1 hypothetical protein HWV03_13955 [Moritella sp. 36]
MKKLTPLILSLATIATTSATAEDKTSGDIDFYLGAKTGYIYTAFDKLDSKIPATFLVGIQKSSFGLEFEGTFVDMDKNSIDLEYESYAIYGTYRTSGTYYAKLRAGYLEGTLKSDTKKWDEDGFSGGIIFGIELGDAFTVEAGYTVIQADLKYFSLGGNVHF